MEMWCLDDTGRDSWDWVGPPAWGRACFNSPEWGGGSSPVETEPPQIVLLLLLLLLVLVLLLLCAACCACCVWCAWCVLLLCCCVVVLLCCVVVVVVVVVVVLWLLCVCCVLLVGVLLCCCVVVLLCVVVLWCCGVVVLLLCVASFDVCVYALHMRTNWQVSTSPRRPTVVSHRGLPKNLLRLKLRLRQLFRQHLDSERGPDRYEGLVDVMSNFQVNRHRKGN